MKHIIPVITILFGSVAVANLETSAFRDGLLIDYGTKLPFTGNIGLINPDWNTIEFSQDYVDGLLQKYF